MSATREVAFRLAPFSTADQTESSAADDCDPCDRSATGPASSLAVPPRRAAAARRDGGHLGLHFVGVVLPVIVQQLGNIEPVQPQVGDFRQPADASRSACAPQASGETGNGVPLGLRLRQPSPVACGLGVRSGVVQGYGWQTARALEKGESLAVRRLLL